MEGRSRVISALLAFMTCVHCKRMRGDHVGPEKKCLFENTFFEPSQP